MTDKVQKIREKIEKRYEYWKEKESNSHGIESEIRMSECQHLLLMLDSLQEEPVSEDLEEASYYFACKCHPLKTEYSTSSPNPEVIDAFKTGAKWQKQQDQSTIELAEDHAMLAGMEKMEEEMMAKAIDAELYSDGMLTPIIKVNDKEKISNIKFGDKVKIIVIKKD